MTSTESSQSETKPNPEKIMKEEQNQLVQTARVAGIWYLVVNHLPILVPVVGVIVMVKGLISTSEAVKRTSYLIFA